MRDLDVTACRSCGRDSCPGDCKVRRFLTDEEVLSEQILEDNVQGIVKPGGSTLFVADSGAGKTLTLMSIGSHLGEGRNFAELHIPHPGSTAYVGYEGDSFKRRYLALRKAGYSTKHLYLLRGKEPLSPLTDRDEQEIPSPGETEVAALLKELAARLEAEGKPPIRMLVIDTFRKSLVGKEEDSARVTAYLRAGGRLLEVIPQAGLVVVHHTGWTASDRPRGSQALRGNVDIEILLKAGKPDLSGVARLSLTSNKERDGAPVQVNLIRKPVPLGEFSETGREFWSAVVIPAPDEESGEATGERVETVSLRVLQAIAKGTFTTSEEVRSRTRLAMNEVRSAIRLLRENRLIEKSGKGMPFRPTPSGLERLNPTTRLNATQPDSVGLDQPDRLSPPLGGVGSRVRGRKGGRR